MDLKTCYQQLGGDYDEVIGRLRREQTVEKFLFKFLEDTSYALLQTSVTDGRYDEAFRAAHTLKGICQNLSFTKLYTSSSRMTEAFRAGENEQAVAGMPQLTADYQQTIHAIAAYKRFLEDVV